MSGYLSGLKPNLLFDPLWYCRQLDGVHDVWSGLRHFVLRGDQEGRAPSPSFSAVRYLAQNPDVAEAGLPALKHYLVHGNREGRARPSYQDAADTAALLKSIQDNNSDAIDQTKSPTVYQALQLRLNENTQKYKDNIILTKPNLARISIIGNDLTKVRLPEFKLPQISILIPVYNELNYTIECIISVIGSKPRVKYEIVIADDCSSDPNIKDLQNVKNLVVVRQACNQGFLLNCNNALRACRGEYVLLLNNDAQLMPGALDSLVNLLRSNPDVAAVGPKILYPDGRLQEAGCTLDRDGVSTMVGLFDDPKAPIFNYTRDVHYCSGAALMIRRSEVGEVLFDEEFKPAYCEDADLCLRLLSRGKRVVYCHEAEVVHHLSVSISKDSVTRRLQTVARNQQKLVQKWSNLLEELNKSRVIAFYLPQYHSTPENDFYWGQGFTEWTNVAKATPAYVGHYQPHLPADLGFYDLRVRQTFQRQRALARRYGIAGFCVYYYNFGSRRALDQAFEAVVADQSLDFPFCVCWANENWTRHWDGGSKEIIFEQQYHRVALLKVIEDAIRYAKDPRYLRVNGKPLFVVYRPLLIPDVQEFAAMCRRYFRKAGFEDVHLVYVESMETSIVGLPPSDLGFDASVEFPPQGQAVLATSDAGILRDQFVGKQYDYEATIIANLSRPVPSYKRYPAVFPSWDNTPRQPLRGDSFVSATPEAFQVYVEEKLEQMRRYFVGDERLLFVNAWNEWAEGTHLEPDRKFGHRWLEAVRNALLTKSLA
jgi:GT2 family glycosyltransferase